MDQTHRPLSERYPIVRIGLIFAAALAFAWAVYLLLQAGQASGLLSFTFLLLLPGILCGFIAVLIDLRRERRLRTYLMIPVWLLLAVIVASLFILKEGVICILILSPLWLGSGMLGAYVTYRLRPRRSDPSRYDGVFCSTLLLVPLVAMQVEPMVPLPVAYPIVTRSIDVAATPAQLWPLLRGIPDVRPGEGRWNVSQDVIGLPRPIGARLVGEGLGAERLANWGTQVRFRERITAWQPGRTIGWRFIFDDLDGWRFTDRHLMPDSPYFKVQSGGYTMQPLGGGRTRVTLRTRYWIKTPVNLYAQLWGELFLGDLENNLLAIVKGRAEH